MTLRCLRGRGPSTVRESPNLAAAFASCAAQSIFAQVLEAQTWDNEPEPQRRAVLRAHFGTGALGPGANKHLAEHQASNIVDFGGSIEYENI